MGLESSFKFKVNEYIHLLVNLLFSVSVVTQTKMLTRLSKYLKKEQIQKLMILFGGIKYFSFFLRTIVPKMI